MSEDFLDRSKDVHCLSLASLNHREDRTKDILAMLCSEAARHLLAVLALAKISFAHVVVKGHSKIMQEQQMLCLVLLQAVQERFFFFARPVEATTVILALL